MTNTRSSEQTTRPGGRMRPLLWLVLAISAADNVATSSSSGHLLVSLGLGVVALLCVVALVVDHYRHR